MHTLVVDFLSRLNFKITKTMCRLYALSNLSTLTLILSTISMECGQGHTTTQSADSKVSIIHGVRNEVTHMVSGTTHTHMILVIDVVP